MAKLGAITALALDASKRSRKPSRSAAPKPVVPTTACTPCSAHQSRLSRAASTTVKSTATSASASTSASALRAICMLGASTPNCRRSMPGVERVDRGDELQLGIAEHRLAHGGAHASRRAEDRRP